MEEWVSIEQLYDAYLDCRKRKRTSQSCALFESNEASNLYELYKDLNNGTYSIGRSNAFCVTRPKVREVFAADFRDRIVHHLIIGKLNPLFENLFIPDTYNCRKGKGTDYGVDRALNYSIEYADGWVLKCDLQGFFMSIYKPLLAERLELFIRSEYKGSDIEQVVKIAKMIALNSPEKNCIRKGNLRLWEQLPPNKSLFSNGDDKGQAIGNLTSQIFANFYLTPLDKMVTAMPNVRYCRYVDDILIFAKTEQELLFLLPKIRQFLKEDLFLTLHPNKIFLQPVSRGFTFIGSTIKRGRKYAGNRTVSNALKLTQFYSKLSLKKKENNIESFAQRYNSYMGYLAHRLTYHIRYRIWNSIDEETKKFVTIKGMRVLQVKEYYKLKIKFYRNYVKKHRSRKSMGGIGSRIRH